MVRAVALMAMTVMVMMVATDGADCDGGRRRGS